ncbi:ESX secretion-associated protein EspG [Rhodococcus sp. HNM0569]|uniref:ESX secretion-associated protein EspG n=1 Tax=Rhodococcus sp. HNM0569 TaxID=2716340 RepID=UPI00146EC6A1|nr:ESX secretion-associated protein EspG [Rhodococcus sp. HNM0569]NLU85052.1 ESX secretion-associated protein EspG [Rhodococcus sp. HNM0569]
MIDLGTDTAAPSLAPTTLSVDEILFLVDRLKLDMLPVVLDIAPRFETIDERDDEYRALAAALEERGLLDATGRVAPDLADALAVVARPSWEIALRWSVGGAVSRLCLSHGEHSAVVTMRAGESLVVRDAGPDPLGAVQAAVGTVPPVSFNSVNAPTQQLSEALDNTADAASLTAALTAIGVGYDDAATVGKAMAGCTTFAEIVGLVYGEGNYDPVGGPVTVFDTDLGRIVGTSSVSGHGVAWSSLAPGTPARFRQALDSLVDRLTDAE